MGCFYCSYPDGSHNCRCPLYTALPSDKICDICKEPIMLGEEYIVNEFGDYIHYECGTYDEQIKWLGGKHGTMEEN